MTDRAEDLQNLLWLINDIDQLIEHAMLRRAPIAETMPRALDRLLNFVPARAITARVVDEEGTLRDFTRPSNFVVMQDQIDGLMGVLEDTNTLVDQPGRGTVYAQRLDISVQFLGGIVAHFDEHHSSDTVDTVQRALYHFAEIVDNYVAGVRDASIKQQALMAISDGFKHTILETALDRAVEALREFVDCSKFALVCQSDEVLERSTYSYRLIISDDVTYSSADDADPRVQSLVDDAVHRLLRNDLVDGVLDELRLTAPHVVDLPMYGMDGRHVVGRVIVGSDERLTPFEVDIVDRFVDYLRQRVVDFSREWRVLSRTFPKPVVEQLMREPAYRQRFLSPREEEVAVLFADITNFTWLSEQVLRSPTEIGNLIDRWSRHVVDIIWETGGVFDKMVGDCIIGIWGPPFYTDTPQERCEAALDAATRIRNYTARLAQDPEFPELAAVNEISVATGINYCPLFVGLFGPDENFTGFSSGMNNAARLQSLASGGEILCMETFVQVSEQPRRFGALQTASVKNVANPLRYRLLK